MSVPAAYFGIVLIWSTTPLAIKWSGDIGFLFASTARMSLSAALGLMLLVLLRRRLPWHRDARRIYLLLGCTGYAAMLSGYWGAQFIPSALISIVFGLTPLITALLASLCLGERSFTPAKVAGLLAGLLGLIVVFGTGLRLGTQAAWGIGAWLVAAFIHSATTVTLKRIGQPVSVWAMTVGGLSLTALLFGATWLATGAHWPQAMPARALTATLYLAVFGSLLGFLLYNYALKRLPASQMALITLITPIAALALGTLFNGERLSREILMGGALILAGLALHQWDERRGRVRSAAPAASPLAEDAAPAVIAPGARQ